MAKFKKRMKRKHARKNAEKRKRAREIDAISRDSSRFAAEMRALREKGESNHLDNEEKRRFKSLLIRRSQLESASRQQRAQDDLDERLGRKKTGRTDLQECFRSKSCDHLNTALSPTIACRQGEQSYEGKHSCGSFLRRPPCVLQAVHCTQLPLSKTIIPFPPHFSRLVPAQCGELPLTRPLSSQTESRPIILAPSSSVCRTPMPAEVMKTTLLGSYQMTSPSLRTHSAQDIYSKSVLNVGAPHGALDSEGTKSSARHCEGPHSESSSRQPTISRALTSFVPNSLRIRTKKESTVSKKRRISKDGWVVKKAQCSAEQIRKYENSPSSTKMSKDEQNRRLALFMREISET